MGSTPDAPKLSPPPPPADYSDALALEAKSAAYQTEIMEKQTVIAERQEAIADDTFKYWNAKIAPLWKQTTAEVRKGTPTEPFEARARNAVIQQGAGANLATDRNLSARGVDPSSPMALSARKDVGTGIAAAAGGAQYGARRRVEEIDRGRQSQMYGVGANIPGQAVAGFGTAAGVMGRAAVPVANAYTNLSNASINDANSMSAIANQTWSLQNQALINNYNNDMQQAQSEQDFWTKAVTVGAIVAACWVARSVYGVDNPRWLMFRAWMLTEAPGWFRWLYLRHGERLAAWLDRHAWAKPAVRKWMDFVIEGHGAEVAAGVERQAV